MGKYPIQCGVEMLLKNWMLSRKSVWGGEKGGIESQFSEQSTVSFNLFQCYLYIVNLTINILISLSLSNV